MFIMGPAGMPWASTRLGGLVGGQILDPLLNDLGNGILIGQTARHINEPGIGDHIRRSSTSLQSFSYSFWLPAAMMTLPPLQVKLS